MRRSPSLIAGSEKRPGGLRISEGSVLESPKALRQGMCWGFEGTIPRRFKEGWADGGQPGALQGPGGRVKVV